MRRVRSVCFVCLQFVVLMFTHRVPRYGQGGGSCCSEEGALDVAVSQIDDLLTRPHRSRVGACCTAGVLEYERVSYRALSASLHSHRCLSSSCESSLARRSLSSLGQYVCFSLRCTAIWPALALLRCCALAREVTEVQCCTSEDRVNLPPAQYADGTSAPDASAEAGAP